MSFSIDDSRSHAKKCYDCNIVSTTAPHPYKEGETQCTTCSNKMYLAEKRNNDIVTIEANKNYVPDWYIQKVKDDIDNFHKGKILSITFNNEQSCQDLMN